jgi:tetratricopeptide (TPR) repeat protein
MAQMEIAADSVIAPCTALLGGEGLTLEQRAAALFVRGRGYHRTKRLKQAADDYDAALRLTPRNEEIVLSRSNIDIRRGDLDRWAQRLRQAFELNPDNPRVLRSVGVLYRHFGHGSEAMAFFARALHVDPAEPFALLFRSSAYLDQRQFAEAIEDATALVAATADPAKRIGYLDEDGMVRNFHVVALINRARILEKAGQRDAAVKDYNAAVAEGHSAGALVARAEFLLATRPEDAQAKAMADLQEAVVAEPTNPPALYTLGLVLTDRRRFEEAFIAFDRAVASRPGYAKALRMRARMHRELGRAEDAFRDFMAAVESNPGILFSSLPALRHAGYWTSTQTPTRLTPALVDAIRACMMDTRCN